MRPLLLAALLTVVGCGGPQTECTSEILLTPPAADPGATCVPEARRCDGADSTHRLCWFDCAGEAVPASGCTPDGYCGVNPMPDGRRYCTYNCPRLGVCQ